MSLQRSGEHVLYFVSFIMNRLSDSIGSAALCEIFKDASISAVLIFFAVFNLVY